MGFGTHGAAAIRQLRNRRHTPNMRVEFDVASHQHYFKFKHGKRPKQLSAKEIAQLRVSIEMAKRHRVKYQILAVLISIVLLAALVWGVWFFICWLQELPADVYH